MSSQESEPQVQPTPQPVVLVVNQQAMMDPRYQRGRREPYLHRGAKFSNGCRCHFIQMIFLCIFGGVLLFMSTSFFIFSTVGGVLLLLAGGVLLGLGIHLIRTAKKQFESLPADDPERAKYVARSNFMGPGQTTAVYAMPPMQNQIMTYPSASGGQGYAIPLAPGNYPPNVAGLDTNQAQIMIGPPGASAPAMAYKPENDQPPAYSDVVRNA